MEMIPAEDSWNCTIFNVLKCPRGARSCEHAQTLLNLLSGRSDESLRLEFFSV